MGVLCTWVKLSTNLQILGCELHKKCVWRPGSARTRWGSYSAPPDPLAIIRGGEGGKGKERVGNRKREGEGRQGREGLGDRKGKGGVGGKENKGREEAKQLSAVADRPAHRAVHRSGRSM